MARPDLLGAKQQRGHCHHSSSRHRFTVIYFCFRKVLSGYENKYALFTFPMYSLQSLILMIVLMDVQFFFSQCTVWGKNCEWVVAPLSQRLKINVFRHFCLHSKASFYSITSIRYYYLKPFLNILHFSSLCSLFSSRLAKLECSVVVLDL